MTHQQTTDTAYHVNGHHRHSQLGQLIHHAAVATVLALLVVVLLLNALVALLLRWGQGGGLRLGTSGAVVL